MILKKHSPSTLKSGSGNFKGTFRGLGLLFVVAFCIFIGQAFEEPNVEDLFYHYDNEFSAPKETTMELPRFPASVEEGVNNRIDMGKLIPTGMQGTNDTSEVLRQIQSHTLNNLKDTVTDSQSSNNSDVSNVNKNIKNYLNKDLSFGGRNERGQKNWNMKLDSLQGKSQIQYLGAAERKIAMTCTVDAISNSTKLEMRKSLSNSSSMGVNYETSKAQSTIDYNINW